MVVIIDRPHHSLTETASEAHEQIPDWQWPSHTCPLPPDNRNMADVFNSNEVNEIYIKN